MAGGPIEKAGLAYSHFLMPGAAASCSTKVERHSVVIKLRQNWPAFGEARSAEASLISIEGCERAHVVASVRFEWIVVHHASTATVCLTGLLAPGSSASNPAG